MELKKFYVPGSVEAGEPRVSHLRVRRATRRWLVSPSVVEQGVAEGYFSLANGLLTIKTAEGEPDIVYRVVSAPGHYCCHCNKRLNDSREGKQHVEAEHAGIQSPDDNNPSGWRRDNHYTMELVSGIEPKPEVSLGQRLRYAAQQEARRAAARQKLAERDARIRREREKAAAAASE